jgi:hypothetical protein
MVSAPAADRVQLVRSVPSSLPLVSLNSENEDQPSPCKCICGGEIHCERGQWAWCECRNGKCIGACSSGKKEPLDLAADVVSVIVEDTVKATDVRNNPDRYSQILEALLKGKVSENKYRLAYRSREIGFSFTENSVSLLRKAREELRESKTQ